MASTARGLSEEALAYHEGALRSAVQAGSLVADQSPATRCNLLNRAYLQNKLMITAAFDNP